MYLREIDKKGYEQVFFYENLLRKTLIWELRGTYGRQWLNELAKFGYQIEDRIASTKRAGAYNEDHSELSYLDLADLLSLIFDKTWYSIFNKILIRKSLRDVAHKGLVAVRNKIAHYRPIDQTDAHRLESAKEVFSGLGNYYGRNLQADAHLSGQDKGVDVLLNPAEIDNLRTVLVRAKLPNLWDDYGKHEGMRASNLSPGIGVVRHHLFFEIFTHLAFAPIRFVDFVRRRRHEVTFLNFGPSAEYVRIFIPLCLGEREIQKLLVKFIDVAKNAVIDPEQNAESLIFDLGYWDQIGMSEKNLYFGFIF